jgi:hypothetical protein
MQQGQNGQRGVAETFAIAVGTAVLVAVAVEASKDGYKAAKKGVGEFWDWAWGGDEDKTVTVKRGSRTAIKARCFLENIRDKKSDAIKHYAEDPSGLLSDLAKVELLSFEDQSRYSDEIRLLTNLAGKDYTKPEEVTPVAKQDEATGDDARFQALEDRVDRLGEDLAQRIEDGIQAMTKLAAAQSA